MSSTNEAHTVFQTNAGVGAAIPVDVEEITTTDILISDVNLGALASITTGSTDVSSFSSVQVNIRTDKAGTLTILEYDYAAKNIRNRNFEVSPTIPLSIRLPIDTRGISVTYLNGAAITTSFSITIRGKANSDDSQTLSSDLEIARTTTPLGADATFDGEWFPTKGFNEIIVTGTANVAGTVAIAWSHDGATSIGGNDGHAFVAGGLGELNVPVRAPYCRAVLINGAAAQATMSFWAQMKK